MQSINEIKQEESFLLETVTQTLQLAQKKAIDVEVVIKKTMGISINIRNNILENVQFHTNGALFITVYNKFSKGFVSSKDLSLNGIKKILEIAIDISKYSSSDFFSGLPDINLLCLNPIDLDLFHPCTLKINDVIKLISCAEAAAFKFDKKIVNSEGSFFSSYTTINVFGNSLGMLQTYKSTLYSNYNCLIAQDKNHMERDFEYSVSRNIEHLQKPEIMGKKAASRVISRLGSRKINSQKSPVIFSSEISHVFFSHLINAISGQNVYQKSTFLINDLKKQIFPEWLNIEENAHLKKGLGSKPFDDEGVCTKSKYIIYNGILQTWLLNSYNARRLKLTSTGNAGGIHNWIVTHNQISFRELLKKMNRGLLIIELMGQGVDIVNGNYSRGAVGFWIENGDISYPVNEITISGNLKDMWSNIINISNDVDVRNNIQCGSVLLSEMQISGN